MFLCFFFSSRRRHTRCSRDWSSDVCSSDLDQQARSETIALLRSKGIDAVLPFRTMLADLISETESNRNYHKSDLLQIIRILKNYDFFKGPQLELFKSRRKKATKVGTPQP